MKRHISVLISMVMLISLVLGINFSALALEQDVEGYYLISSAADFAQIETNTSGNYRIIADITEAITTPVETFSGTLTGWDAEAGKAVERTVKVNISSDSIARLGLFSNITDGASVSYLKIEGSVVNKMSSGWAGGLTGFLGKATVSNVTSCVSINAGYGSPNAGGIAGYANPGYTMTNCANTGTIYASYCAGGLIGASYVGTITKCYNIGAISGGNPGGFVGNAVGPLSISDSYNAGQGTRGFIAAADASKVADNSIIISGSYTTTSGFCGAEGKVLASPTEEKPDILNSYYLSDVTSGNGLTAEDMAKEASFAGWDFSNTWEFNTDDNYYYPQLKGMTQDIQDGTAAHPYKIKTAADFAKINNAPSAYYRVVADITEAVTAPVEQTFAGNLTGWDMEAGKEVQRIVNLKLDDASQQLLGLFRNITGGNVSNLILTGSVKNSFGNARTGALTGNAGNNTKIENIINKASVTTNVGSPHAAGIVGFSNSTVSIKQCINEGDITSSYNAGGIVGWSYISSTGSISKCYNTGKIISTSGTGGSAGGIVGLVRLVFTISDSYNTGALTGKTTGGIVAASDNGFSGKIILSACYTTTPSLSGADIVSATNEAPNLNSYYLADTTSGNGLSAADMKKQTSFSGWDFVNTWEFYKKDNYYYPQLQNMRQTAEEKGTAKNPYWIETAADFAKIANDSDGYYYVVTDITEAITTPVETFSGNLTGWDAESGKEVQRTVKLNLNDTSVNYLGLFRRITGGTVSNLILTGSVDNNSGGARPGALVGYLHGGTLSNITNRATVTANAGSTHAGGIVGLTDGCSIVSCINEAQVSSQNYSGGLVGWVLTSGATKLISKCYNTGKIVALQGAGGIAGFADAAFEVSNSYSNGEIQCSTKGGIIGKTTATASITNSYTTVSSLCGSGSATLNNSYYLSDVTSGNGLTAADMKQQSSFSGWDFSNTWEFNTDDNYYYPQLQGMRQPAAEEGTALNPYRIATAEDFAKIADAPDAYYYIIADVTGTITTPIANFGGNITGWDVETGEPAIRTINVDIKSSAQSTGLFNVLSGSASYIKITGSVISTFNGGAYTAGLAGNATGTAVINNVINEARIGSVGPSAYVGGIVGICSSKSVTECANLGTVIGSYVSGGIIGWSYVPSNGIVSECYNSGTIRTTTPGITIAGGIIGLARLNCTVSDCYNTGIIKTKYETPVAGGIIGSADERAGAPVVVNNSYTTAYQIAGETEYTSVSESCYYLAEEATKNGGLTAEGMAIQGSFAGWDFDGIWTMDASTGYSYPQLQAIAHNEAIFTPVTLTNLKAYDSALTTGDLLSVAEEDYFKAMGKNGGLVYAKFNYGTDDIEEIGFEVQLNGNWMKCNAKSGRYTADGTYGMFICSDMFENEGKYQVRAYAITEDGTVYGEEGTLYTAAL